MAMRIGDLRHRLALETCTRIDDGAGGAVESWGVMAEVWAAIRPLAGDEREMGDALGGRVTHEVWIRHRAGVFAEMRFTASGRTFEIRAVIDDGERRRFMKCLCEERNL